MEREKKTKKREWRRWIGEMASQESARRRWEKSNLSAFAALENIWAGRTLQGSFSITEEHISSWYSA
jgi:hypothetical protein